MDKKEELENEIVFYQRKLKEGRIEEDPEIKNAIKSIKDIAAIEDIKINKNISSDDLYTIWEEYDRRSSESQVLDVECGKHIKVGRTEIIVFILSILIIVCPDPRWIPTILNMILSLGVWEIIAAHPELLKSESYTLLEKILEIIKDVLERKFR